MVRRLRQRIEKIEELLSVERKERREKLRQTIRALTIQARHHAIAVAAIVLSGQPKVDEPLRHAWARALQHYGININPPERLDVAAHRLYPIIMGGEEESARFAKIFKTAPVWLLQFTGIASDGRHLKFEVPLEVATSLPWGSAGYEDARRWPLLPLGTMAAGDPIPRSGDPRQMWLALWCQLPTPFDVEDVLCREYEESCSPSDNDVLEELVTLFADSYGKTDKESTRYEKRRMRRVIALASRLEE